MDPAFRAPIFATGAVRRWSCLLLSLRLSIPPLCPLLRRRLPWNSEPLRVPNRHEDVDAQSVLVGLVRPERPAFLEACLAQHEGAVRLGGVVTDAFSGSAETAAECLLPERRLELNEFRSALESALGSLPARIAQAFTMYEVDEYSGREVCHRMEISETNLWVMLHRARKQLRTLLPEWGRG